LEVRAGSREGEVELNQ